MCVLLHKTVAVMHYSICGLRLRERSSAVCGAVRVVAVFVLVELEYFAVLTYVGGRVEKG